MPVFKLDRFPNVCRLCLQPTAMLQKTVPVSEVDEVLGCSIDSFIETFTFKISQNKAHLFPRNVCVPCLELLRFYAKYRSRVLLIHRLTDCLAEMRLSNAKPIEALFQCQSKQMAELIKDLDLSSKRHATVKELLNEFPLYEIALCPDNYESGINFDLEWIDRNFVGENIESEMISDTENIDRHSVSDELSEDDLSVESGDEIGGDPLPNSLVAVELNDEDVEAMVQKPSARKRFIHTKIVKIVSAEPKNVDVNKKCKPSGSTAARKLEPRLDCPHCTYKSYSISWLHAHVEKRHNRVIDRPPPDKDADLDTNPPKEQTTTIKTYKCYAPHCTETFTDAKLFCKHGIKEHGALVCEMCGARFQNAKLLEIHRKRHLNKKEYRCPYCHKGFNIEPALKMHIKTRHDATQIFKCDICGLEFRTSVSLKDHALTHSGGYDVPCPLCEKKFKNKTRLHRHHEEVHLPRQHTCPHCPRVFARVEKLMDHVEAVHKIQMRFYCDICVQMFRSQDELDAHKYCHDNPAKLQCGICLDVYPSEEQIKEHLCITYRDDYICCGRDLRNPYMYNKHMFQKHGQKTKVRVKHPEGILVGVLRAQRKRVESCPKCETIFPTRTLKKQHVQSCVGPAGATATNTEQ